MKIHILSAGFLLALLAAFPKAAIAGPPFQTDDPEPIDFRNYEFYTFGTVDHTFGESDTVGPAAEFNWGALPNVHLHIILPVAGIVYSNNGVPPGQRPPNVIGLGDIETGIKFRFIQETKTRPMIGTFVMFELPTGSASKTLGVGKTWFKVPLWTQKSWGPWTAYGGGGETLYKNSPGYDDYPFAGGLLQRDIGKKLTLGGEAFYHGAEGAATPLNASATLLDFGGYYKFRDPGFQFLFCYGHSVAGPAETYAYVGLYWTWGRKDTTTDKDSARRNSPPPSFATNAPIAQPRGFGGF